MPKQEKTHSLRIGAEKLGIYQDNRRLYKFVSWSKAKHAVEEFIKQKLLLHKPELKNLGELHLNIKSANPMRRTMFGNFYLDVEGQVVDSEQRPIADFKDWNFKHLNFDHSYICHDEEENEKRSKMELKFGQDQYPKELAIKKQALEDLLEKEEDNTIILNKNNPEAYGNFIKKLMEASGWSSSKDNRLYSRIKRLPPYMIIPE